MLLAGCAVAHPSSDDAPVPIDVDLTEALAPRCPSVPTPRFEARSEGILAIASGEGAPGASILAADTYGDRTDVLLRFDDYVGGGARFALARFERGEVSTIDLESVGRETATSGDVIARERETRVTWDVCVDPASAGRCPEQETRRVTVPLGGSPTPIEITARFDANGHGRMLDLGEETVIHGSPRGFFVDHLTRPDEEVAVAVVGTTGWPVGGVGAGRWLGWTRAEHRMVEEPWLVAVSGAEVVADPLRVPVAAATDVVLGEPWVVYLERLDDDLARSRLRISHLRATDLSRAEPDRWLDGWGGFAPSARVVELDGAPWVFFVTVDARYDAEVLHAARLDGLPCGRSVEEAAWTPADAILTRFSGVLPWGAPVIGAGDHVVVFARREDAIELTSLRVAR